MEEHMAIMFEKKSGGNSGQFEGLQMSEKGSVR